MAEPSGAQPATYSGLTDLYVTDFGTSAVELLKNKGYAPDGSINSGLTSPMGDFLDHKGNLYVADSIGKLIEYAPGGSSPSFTYSDGMVVPVNVSVDRRGHIFDADAGVGGYHGFVAEYSQEKDKMLRSCSPAGAGTRVAGVAEDKAGDVFIDYSKAVPSGPGHIVEYKGGLKGCNGTVLGAPLGEAGGMVIDKDDNLIVCDQKRAKVEVIAPPYSRVTRTIGSGYYLPYNVTINQKNSRVFVADINGELVFVFSYPKVRLLARLGYTNGLHSPVSAVDGPNASY